ncbi:hypothetical protein ABL78_3922 [Leptomonas seymouri]|uniref:RRM domain-containing protein n=1 Tax=Leptomonas seymouri TaxID=5684 RepID=A0A0N1HXA6_LEPSE|nr:hypothetical protein ABL78_3922 [Leptomonas seymouri]|eukprot:KPI87010.1 hypothetical protein ABL78_3922 [Leptomonas seymouri]
MDPSKRICLKNLPAGCTKREIAELIRNRTGTPIHSIDLGLGPDGEVRRYAHFSCEGAKHVLEVLGSGVTLRDSTIYAHPAKMHYSFRYAEARRKREREEAEEKEQLEAYWAASKQRFLDRTNGGELPKDKPPKDFYASKRKYARIAAVIAQTFRNQSGAAHCGAERGDGRGNYNRGAAHVTTTSFGEGKKGVCEHSASSAAPAAVEGAAGADSHHQAKGASPASRPHKQAGNKRPPRAAAAKAKAPAAPPPPPPSEPTKEERKLSGLQAKLAALKEKLKKT